MLKAGTETGSLVNHLVSGASSVVPVVGMGATMLGWTDRVAGTVVKVTKTQVHVQRDDSKRTDTNGMSDQQTYEYTPDPTASIYIYRKTKRGWRSNGGYSGLWLGVRQTYHDYSF